MNKIKLEEQSPIFYCPYEMSIETMRLISEMDNKLPVELLNAIYGDN